MVLGGSFALWTILHARRNPVNFQERITVVRDSPEYPRRIN